MSKIIENLKLNQASTWRGIIGVLGSFGVVLSPELTESIIALCVAGFGVIEVIRNEKATDDDKQS